MCPPPGYRLSQVLYIKYLSKLGPSILHRSEITKKKKKNKQTKQTISAEVCNF